MIKNLARLLPIAAAAALALPALAGQVTLSNIRGTWSDAIPAANATYFNGNSANPQVRWGTGGPQSGYNFGAVAGPLVYNLPPNTPIFSLGTFEHLNFPINAGTSITSVKLKVTANVDIDGNDQGDKDFFFDFTHNETPNGANPCANPAGPNENGCADSVKVAYNNQSDVFEIDGDEYTLNVFGFKKTVDGNPFTEWWTAEGKKNSAFLAANITLVEDVGPPDEIPEPGTLALAGLAMMGLAAARRRKAS
jgi:hypothetical protein